MFNLFRKKKNETLEKRYVHTEIPGIKAYRITKE